MAVGRGHHGASSVAVPIVVGRRGHRTLQGHRAVRCAGGVIKAGLVSAVGVTLTHF